MNPAKGFYNRNGILKNLFAILLLVLFVQFIAKVYAMTFTLAYSSTETKVTRNILIADLDNDGDLDYVAGNYDSGPAVDNDVYRNDGGVSFTRMGGIGSSTSLEQFSAKDIDGDGDIDICIVNGSVVSVYKNVGNFTFVAGYSYDYVSGGFFLDVVDLDNDGDQDIVLSSTSTITQAVHTNDGHGNFSIAASTLPASTNILLADFNSDGFPDLALADSSRRFRVMVNDGTGAFIDLYAPAPDGSATASFAAGDLDGDGDIDLITAHSDFSNMFPWFNNGIGTNFVVGSEILIGSGPRAIALSDLDNDGDLDVLLAASGGIQAFLNNGLGNFTISGTAIGVADVTRDVESGDFDGDGDLDFLAGNAGSLFAVANRIYANDQAATLPNTAPTAPSSLTAVKVSDNGSTATVRLSWGSGSDTQTATRMLQYQLKVGTGSAANNIISGKTASPNWVSRVMPNGQSRTMLLQNIPCNKTFYWNAATVDTGFKSTWGTEQTFTVDASCAIATTSSATPDPGGGLPAWWFRQKPMKPDDDPLPPDMSTVSLSAFHDLDGDGVKQDRELLGFAGLPITASGRTLGGDAVQKTVFLGQKGTATLELESSDERGYWFLVGTGSAVTEGFTRTGKLSQSGAVLPDSVPLLLDFGFRRETLLSYAPCLRVGEPTENEESGPDAKVLLRRLEDPFGSRILRDIDVGSGLLKRRDFFRLLQRSFCIPVERESATFAETLRATAKKLSKILPFVDHPISSTESDALLAYSLFAHGISVERQTTIGLAADFSSPITRGEAIRAIVSVLPASARTLDRGEALPTDLPDDDPLAQDFRSLRSLGILPNSFLTMLGKNEGVDTEEASVLFTRAAFVGGKIDLLPSLFDAQNAAPAPTFPSLLPNLARPSCLESDDERSSTVSFTDILPGDSFYDDTRALLSLGTTNTQNKTLWLVPATKRPTEYGVKRGQVRIELDEPVTLLETIRSLLVLACLPPPTNIEVANGASKKDREGSAESLIPRDRISGLPRDHSFASRILHRAQDHIKAFDLSLLRFAPHLLRQEEKAPAALLSIEDASDLLASGLLMIHVREETLTLLEAENLFQELSALIREDLIGERTDWRTEASLRTKPFTRGMLHRFLAATMPMPDTSPLSIGEMWWERVR